MAGVTFFGTGFDLLMAIDTLTVKGVRSFGHIRVIALQFMTFETALGIRFPLFQGMMAIPTGKAVT